MPAGVRELRLLNDRQRVHVGTQADGPRAAPMTQRPDDARAGEAFADLDAEIAQRGGDDARGAPLFEGKLGMGMQVTAQRNQLWHQIVDLGGTE